MLGVGYWDLPQVFKTKAQTGRPVLPEPVFGPTLKAPRWHVPVAEKGNT